LTAIRSGKYKQQLMDAMQQIDNWILRIQPLANAETYHRLQVLKEDVSGFSTALDKKIDRVLDNIDNLPNDVVRQLIPELSSLLRQNTPIYVLYLEIHSKRQPSGSIVPCVLSRVTRHLTRVPEISLKIH